MTVCGCRRTVVEIRRNTSCLNPKLYAQTHRHLMGTNAGSIVCQGFGIQNLGTIPEFRTVNF